MLILLGAFKLRVKWVNLLAYRLRIWRKQDYHRRSVNDAKLAIQSCGLWGTAWEKNQPMQIKFKVLKTKSNLNPKLVSHQVSSEIGSLLTTDIWLL